MVAVETSREVSDAIAALLRKRGLTVAESMDVLITLVAAMVHVEYANLDQVIAKLRAASALAAKVEREINGGTLQ
jgi:hypothetical protein